VNPEEKQEKIKCLTRNVTAKGRTNPTTEHAEKGKTFDNNSRKCIELPGSA
jgi:hypothetical protein